jgi:hypothetical protein
VGAGGGAKFVGVWLVSAWTVVAAVAGGGGGGGVGFGYGWLLWWLVVLRNNGLSWCHCKGGRYL